MQAKSEFIMSLSNASAGLAQVGGKGASLARLAAAGLPVPPGFYITTTAYRRFVDENGIQPRILDALKGIDSTDPTTLEPVSCLIGGFFTEGRISSEIAESVSDAYATLKGVPVAVRSSATAEDLPEASFAGQQETYLNIRGTEAVLEAVKKCWGSLWTARAIAYRARQGIDPDSVALAVVVQELVCADAAGVVFTANPISGKRDEIIITATWGLGEAIVSGAVTPDTLTLEKTTGRVIRLEIAEKQIMTVRTESGTSEVPVPDSQKKKEVLSDAQAAELARLGVEIEKLYGMPMDIEWALAGGRFAILQARPITALPPEPLQWPRPEGGMMMRASLCEQLPNPVSPLFGTLGVRMVNIPTAELGEIVMGNGGRSYQYRIVNGYFFLSIILGLKEVLYMFWAVMTEIGKTFLNSRASWQEARGHLAQIIAKWDAKNLETCDPTELLDGACELMMAAGKFYAVIQMSTLPNASSSEAVFKSLYSMVKCKNDPEAERLLFGLESAPLRAEKSLFDLGNWIRQHPALCNFALRIPASELAAALQASVSPETIPTAEWSEFKERFSKYLDQFGHTSYEFDFINPTPAETPEVLLDAIKMYAAGKGSDPHERQRRTDQLREQTLKNIQSRFKLIPNAWFNAVFRWASGSGPAREDSLADLGMGHTTIRRLLGELGRRLAANGALGNAEDIYWLEEDEVAELVRRLERNEKLPDWSDRISPRKAAWQEQMKLIPPVMLPENSPFARMLPWARENASGSVLKGLGASAGKVTAPACVMFSPEDFHRMKPGSVLVAVITTPAWTPLFTLASAVVTDIGGPLSHSSIVAREYGIPAVLATRTGTRRIQDGQIITVDGVKGEVILDTTEEVQAKQPTRLLEWKSPYPKPLLARGSSIDLLPDVVSPLFATLGIPILTKVYLKMYAEVMGLGGEDVPIFEVINGYIFLCFIKRSKFWKYMLVHGSTAGKLYEYGKVRAEEAHAKCHAVVTRWRQMDLASVPAPELLAGVCDLFEVSAEYLNASIDRPIPQSNFSELFFSLFYNALIKRKTDPPATTFLLGLENLPLRAEKSLFDLAQWAQTQPELANYLQQTPTQAVWAALQADPVPAPLSGEFAARFVAHLAEFGHLTYDLDFMTPVPAEEPVPMLDTLKVYLSDRGSNPYTRQGEQERARQHAEQAISQRTGSLRRKWFQKLLASAQECAAERENAIANIGLPYPQLRRLLRELGQRLVAGGAIAQPEDIYWLEAQEADALATTLEKKESLSSYAASAEARKAGWKRAREAAPPTVLPENHLLAKMYSPKKPQINLLRGKGTSAGQVTAPACVLRGPEDFGQMHPGDVLVAVATTPAWTPLFVMASAVVTDIGGPLSHSSIVAREYGIPAVMATGVATRLIHTGQMITVDGSAGTVTLKA